MHILQPPRSSSSIPDSVSTIPSHNRPSPPVDAESPPTTNLRISQSSNCSTLSMVSQDLHLNPPSVPLPPLRNSEHSPVGYSQLQSESSAEIIPNNQDSSDNAPTTASSSTSPFSCSPSSSSASSSHFSSSASPPSSASNLSSQSHSSPLTTFPARMTSPSPSLVQPFLFSSQDHSGHSSLLRSHLLLPSSSCSSSNRVPSHYAIVGGSTTPLTAMRYPIIHPPSSPIQPTPATSPIIG